MRCYTGWLCYLVRPLHEEVYHQYQTNICHHYIEYMAKGFSASAGKKES